MWWEPLEVDVPFLDRVDAGRRMADRLAGLRAEHPVVIGLPRGGVPVAAQIAGSLGAPLDVLVVRKLGHPLQPELGIGAIGEGGALVLNLELIDHLCVSSDAIRRVRAREELELVRRVERYRGGRARIPLQGRTVVLVDDGLATGFTARTAVDVLRHLGAQRVVLAIPVAPAETIAELRPLADDVVCLEIPPSFGAIGEWYADFDQVQDTEVIALLARAAARPASAFDALTERRGSLGPVPGGTFAPVQPPDDVVE